MSVLLLSSLVACSDKDKDAGADSIVVPMVPRIFLVPEPAAWVEGEGTWTLDDTMTLSVSSGAEAVGELLAASLRGPTGYALPVTVGADGAILLTLDPDVATPESYVLTVDEDGVEIVAGDAAGLFYGAQTFRQLLPPEVFGTGVADVAWAAPFVEVEDAPRYPWRGAMIDVARHFFTVEEVERQIDLFSLHKLNRLHLHLTDDQGWRIEILSWPLLTEIGGRTEVGGGPGGWYTQADYQEIVAYAAARFVTVVPEIDLPGHAHAAMASYAELNESGEALDLYTGESVISTGIWTDGPATAGFVRDVWTEVADLTPGAWVHVGGDEAVDSTDADYQAFLLATQDLIHGLGKTMVGWDEIGDVPLEPPVVAQDWIDEERAASAAEQGASVVASPARFAYFDMVHDSDATYGQGWAGPVSVLAAWGWNPDELGISPEAVLGPEAALWTEFIDDTEKMDFMLWPRVSAMADLAWGPEEGRDWQDFRTRLARHGLRLEAAGVGFYRTPDIDWE